MVCPDTCVVPLNRIPQEEKPDMTSRMSKRKTPTITRTCALPLAAFISPFTAVLTAVLPFSIACSTPDRAADAPLDAALPPAVCAAALVVPGERKADGADDDKPYTIASETVEVGEMPGVLLRAPRGANGFGYDPLFVPNDQPQRAVDAGEKLTSAEMEPAEKNAVSHRGKALRALVASIEALVK